MPELTINLITDECPEQYAIPTDTIIKVLNDAYNDAGIDQPTLVNLMITSDEKIAVMNEQYLDHEGPTDVIAFDDGDEEDGVLLIGDIAVSADTAAKTCENSEMSFDEELSLYCLHGFLHLTGMRDKTDEGRQEMIDKQAEIFSRNNLKYIP